MTRDDIIRMAREVGILDFRDDNSEYVKDVLDGLERFASLVAADERIACAISCEVNAARWVDDMRKNYAAHECAAAIRARGT